MSVSVVVSKSLPVVVRPSSDTAGSGHVELSSFDKCYASLPVTSLLVFDHPIDNPVETIKRALSRSLDSYGPIAGRVSDEDRITCTGEGVSFVGATASCPLLPTSSTFPMRDLTLQYPAGMCRHGESLLLMQVTQFSCGGFTVGVTWNHAVADGKGMAQFLQAVGELARGMAAPSVRPVRSCDKGTLLVIPESAVAMHRLFMNICIEDMVALDVTVPWSLIRRMKANYGCTIFEAVAAVLWRCRTRSIVSGRDVVTPLSFPCNLRKHLGTKDGYYGNCFTAALVHATAGSVAHGEMGDVVDLVKSGKENVLSTMYSSEKLQLGASGSGSGESRPTVDQIKSIVYNITSVGSWRNLGFEGSDFGHGAPSRVMWHMEQASGPCFIACPPCKGIDGVNVMSRCLKPEHVDAFLYQLASM